jgi:hypothetical protein
MRAAEDMEAFYEYRHVAANAGTGEILAITTDGKGVSMRHEDLRPATRKAAEKRRPKRKKRRSKGEKGATRRMAQVAAVYTVAPHLRAPEDIVQELHPDAEAGPRQPRPRPEHKRVWASVTHDAAVVITQAFEEALRRDPERRKRWVVLVDGAEHQLDCVKRCIRRLGVKAVVIVDIIHVIEYLWNAANAFFGEGANKAEAWVNERLYRVLCRRGPGARAGGPHPERGRAGPRARDGPRGASGARRAVRPHRGPLRDRRRRRLRGESGRVPGRAPRDGPGLRAQDPPLSERRGRPPLRARGEAARHPRTSGDPASA